MNDILSRWRASSPSEHGRLGILQEAVKCGCVDELCDVQEQQRYGLDPDEFIIAKQEYWYFDRNIIIKGTIFLSFFCFPILFEEFGILNCVRDSLLILSLLVILLIAICIYMSKNAKPKNMKNFIVTNKRIYFSISEYIDINKIFISNLFFIHPKYDMTMIVAFNNGKKNMKNVAMLCNDNFYIFDVVAYIKRVFSYIAYICPARYSFEECKLKRTGNSILYILSWLIGGYGRVHTSADQKSDKRFSSRKDTFLYFRRVLCKSNNDMYSICRNYLKNRKDADCQILSIGCYAGFKKCKVYFTKSSIYIMRDAKKIVVYTRNQGSEFPVYEANEHFLIRHHGDGKDDIYKIPKKSLLFPFLEIVEMIYDTDIVMLNTIDIQANLFGWIWRS